VRPTGIKNLREAKRKNQRNGKRGPSPIRERGVRARKYQASFGREAHHDKNVGHYQQVIEKKEGE